MDNLLFIGLLTVLLIINSAYSLPIGQDFNPVKYLTAFGWVDGNQLPKNNFGKSSSALTDIRGGVLEFQTFAGLPQTGELDEETMSVMRLPRCGTRDRIHPNVKAKKMEKLSLRHKRYVLQGSRWKARELYYYVSKYPRELGKAIVDTEIAAAFKLWEREANLTFVRVSDSRSKVHIDIRFESGYHGDEEAFDGRGGTTAHAYFPVYGGDVHFDDDEVWTAHANWGINLFQVATHEIGHSLGLEHSNFNDSIMAPFYKYYQPDFKLHSDDINAIQKLYGKKKELVLCEDPRIDAVTTMIDGATYIFKGAYVYQLSKLGGISDGYPKVISYKFRNLPDKIDAAITRNNGISYFFKGDKFWRVSNMVVDSGFPKNISEYFEGIPMNLDAALVFSVDDNIYFFKGDKYWKFDHTKRPPVAKEYPKPISNWVGIPDNIDSVVSLTDGYSGITYFFKGGKFWKFNDKSFSVDIADPPYPRSAASWLYACNK